MTIKELANSIGVSKTTINNAIRDLGLSPSLKEGHKQMLDLSEDEVKAIRDRLLLPQTEKREAEKTENQTENQTEKTEKQTKETTKSQEQTEKQTEKVTEKQDNTIVLIEMLREELKAKNEQLAIKDKQIQDLSDRLSEASANLSEALKATRGQQYIAAQDKAAQMIEADQRKYDPVVDTQNQQTADQQVKKSWLAKLLGL